MLALTGPLGLAVVQFIRFGPQVIAAIKTWTAGIFSAGANIVRTLAEGMISALHYPIDAIKSMAEKVRAYLPFSPAKEGPLAELHRVRIVETIAQQIRPGPIAAAMRTAAAAAVVSVPVMVSAAPMVHAAMPLARASMPVLEASTRIRPVVVPLIGDGLIRARPWTDDERGNAWRPPATLAGRTGNILHITVNAPVTINANGGKVDYQRDFERQLEQHRTKILALIESALHDRERTKF